MGDLSVFQVLLHHPELAGAVYGLLGMLLWEGQLDHRLRELAIMRIGWATASVYEWTQHWRVALGLGLTEDELVAVREWRSSDRFTELDRLVLAATDETLEGGTITAQTWAGLEGRLGDKELLELVVAIGNWRLFSSLLRSVDIPLEEGVEPWPPDGRSP
jgi:alkylhydroperoxidase family enzyme